MTNNKQSSVDWFLDKLIEHRIIIVDQTTYGDKVKPKHEILLEQAKAMRKEEMMDFAFQVGRGQDYDDEEVRELAKIVYNETFGE